MTGNQTAYDFLGPRYCPASYSLQVIQMMRWTIGVKMVIATDHFKPQFVFHTTFERKFVAGEYGPLPSSEQKTGAVQIMDVMPSLPKDVTNLKEQNEVLRGLKQTCRLCYNQQKAGRSILASYWSRQF